MISGITKAYDSIRREKGEKQALSLISTFLEKYSLVGLWKPLLEKIKVSEKRNQLKNILFVKTAFNLSDFDKEKLVKEFELGSISEIKETFDESLVSGLIISYKGKQFNRTGKKLLEQFNS